MGSGTVGGLFLALNVDYADDDLILQAGERAEIQWLRARCLMKRLATDGRITDAQLRRLGLSGVQARSERLVAVGLWRRIDGGYVDLTYLDTNPSAAQIEAAQDGKSAGGKLGNHRRWHREIPSPECPYCSLDRSHSESVDRSHSESTETETSAVTDSQPSTVRPSDPKHRGINGYDDLIEGG